MEHVKQEKAILARLDYPFIVNLLGCCQDDKCVHLVLEYVCGYVWFLAFNVRNEFMMWKQFVMSSFSYQFKKLYTQN